MKTKSKTIKRMLAMLLVSTMLFSSTAFAAGPAGEANGLAAAAVEPTLISLTDADTFELEFQLTSEAKAAVTAGSEEVVWELQRTATYANPTEEFIPILNEKEMYPNEVDKIDLVAGAGSFKTKDVTTTVTGDVMTVSFTMEPITSSGFPSAPHSNGGSYLDVCGIFTLVATVNGEEVASQENIVIKPYKSFHTMWEIYDELARLATLGDNNAETAAPYVEYNVMGKSNLGYDMPYLIVAKDKAAVENWLALTERAETEPAAVLAEIEAGTLKDYQVPVMYSNIHANEVAAADGVMGFAKMLVEQKTISYKELTGLTEAGETELTEQRETMGLHTSQLIADSTNFLGGILPETSLDVESRTLQYSGVVENFDSYYTSENTTVVVDEMLDDVFFILVPEENVEGRMYVTRASSGGYDLNRDNSFQTQAETQNMQKLIGTYNPVTLLELHGQVESFQVEPCSPPHEPNVEYDLLSNYLMAGGEAFGAAAVANNAEYQSYVIPMRDYLYSDAEGNAEWSAPWDDMSTSYTPQFAMLQGSVAYTVELPAYSEATRTAATYGLLGLSDFVAENKAGYFANQVEVYERCANNENTDEQVRPWLVDSADVIGAEGELFRPANKGNGQFFPECYIIPLDSKNQKNLQAAYDMLEWLTRNDVKVSITDKVFAYKGVSYPAGTMIVSMHQAKRAVANGVLYQGTVIRNWNSLYSEGITAFNYTRGFDMVTCDDPGAYKTIAAAVGTTYDYDAALSFLAKNANSVLSGETGGDVIISNASEDAVAAVNALLQSGKKVGMITEGEYEGDFITSYANWLSVADDYVLTGTGVSKAEVTAYYISGAPTVYISGTANALRESTSGYVHVNRITSSSYNYDRMAMEIMNFKTTTDAAKADAVIGATALDTDALAAVQKGVPYIGYSNSVVNGVNSNLIPVAQERTAGMDCLSYVTYPNKTLTNASYINDGDNVMYGYGTRYFTTMPEGAVVLVQGDDTKAPLEGFLNGDDASYKAFLGGVKGFSYEGADMNGNEVNITLFANTLTNKAHQRDEYAFISNTIFANMLTENAYVAAEPSMFEDVAADAYYADAVEWAVSTGVTTGTDASHFAPDTVCTRGQVVTFLWRAAGCPEVAETTVNPFTDVKADAYYFDAVLWAVEQGITTGTTETTFSPNTTVTRGQAVTFQWREAGAPAAAGTNPFVDVAAGAYYMDATVWAVSEGITNGTTATTFSPDQGCTRAQIVTMLYRGVEA